MVSLFFRTASLLVRFACPIIILYFSSSKALGEYYLFNAFYTFCVFLISLETAIPFSRTYLRTTRFFLKKKVFVVFISNLLILGVFLATPLTIFNWWTNSHTGRHMFMMILALSTGACVNETGRFFWNVGYTEAASRRELYCSVAFLIAVVSSVILSGEAISPIFFGILIVFNLSVIFSDIKIYGSVYPILPDLDFRRAKRILRRCYQSIKESAPQVIHIQILSFYPFLERLFIEKKVGLEIVGSYSFNASLIQSGLSLLLTPEIFKVRKKILLGDSENQNIAAARGALRLLGLEIMVVLIMAAPIYFTIPWINRVTHKEIITSFPILLTAALSTLAISYSNAISPFFASKERLLMSNLATLFVMFPFVVGLGLATDVFGIPLYFTMSLLSFCALLQLGIRLLLYFKLLLRAKLNLV